jgi:type I restriction enzyme R subunit
MVIEAKRLWSAPDDGMQQAIRYATKLGVPLALSTNGTGWVLYGAATGHQAHDRRCADAGRGVGAARLGEGTRPQAQDYLRAPFNRELKNADGSVKELRYYQRRAIHEVLCAMSAGRNRILLVMATGSGKTFTAFQLVWKLWRCRLRTQQASGERNFRVLYLADRDFLVSQPMRQNFQTVFGDAVARVSTHNKRHSPDIYFATYQGLTTASPDADVPADPADPAETKDLLQNYPSDFFDLVIVDECHRGSARAESEWRGILDHFGSAVQLGLTATPVDRNGADTFGYFGNPVFTYSLAEGIEDGFLAPYTIRRVVVDVDAEGLEVLERQRDTTGQLIPAGTFGTRDDERRLQLPDRTRAMARRIVDVIGDTDDRAVVFCVDAAHASAMCEQLRNLRPERTRDPEWVARIMSIEREKDRLLEQFTDPERHIPQIAVTSMLLSTGVDIKDLKYVVIARPIGSMAEFKQIIGRGSRLYPDKGKTERSSTSSGRPRSSATRPSTDHAQDPLPGQLRRADMHGSQDTGSAECDGCSRQQPLEA